MAVTHVTLVLSLKEFRFRLTATLRKPTQLGAFIVRRSPSNWNGRDRWYGQTRLRRRYKNNG